MFKHLKEKFEVKGKTAWMEMPELGDEAKLLLRPATQENKSYWNAMLRKSSRGLRRMARGRIRADDLNRNRKEDRELFPEYVMADWWKVPDENGNYVDFSKENAKELCEQLPDHLFDRVRNFAASAEEFYAEEDEPPMDSEDAEGDLETLAENSETVSPGS